MDYIDIEEQPILQETVNDPCALASPNGVSDGVSPAQCVILSRSEGNHPATRLDEIIFWMIVGIVTWKNIKKQGIGWVRKTYSVVVSIPKNRFIGYTCCFWDTHRKSFKWWRESIVVHRLTGKKWEYQRSLPVGNGVGKWVDQFTLSKLGYNEMLMSCLSSLARMEHQSYIYYKFI